MRSSGSLVAPALAVLLAAGACGPSAASPTGPPSGAIDGPSPPGSPSGGPSDGLAPGGSVDRPSPFGSAAATGGSASPAPSVATTAAPSASSNVVAHDPDRFSFAAKGMSGEVMAFVPVPQLEYAVDTMDWGVVSTVAFFSLEATAEGTIATGSTLRAWNSERMDRLIETAHDHGSKVVLSLKRFSWSAGQTAATRELLGDRSRRERLARAVAQEVARRGVDGVNVDFEPIPSGQKDAFTHFVRTLRRELDATAPDSQLTFCVIGHHESYDVDALTGPDAADAVYLMGYHYAGTWSTRAGSTAPMGARSYDVVDTVKSLLREVERHELIVGVPYYGHAWPTAGDGLRAPTRGGGFDVTIERANDIVARHGIRYDEGEQVAWVPYRARPCDGCALTWYQLYFDDARASRYKWAWIRRNRLLGTGIWTIGFEGRPGPHNEALRDVFAGADGSR